MISIPFLPSAGGKDFLMEVIRITDRKKEYLPLLLLADEEEHKVDR